jgi:hypothetical protein
MPFPQHDPLTYKCFLHNIIVGCVGEYSITTHTLAPFSFAPTSPDTTLALTTLQPKSNGYFLFFLKDYELDQNIELFFYSFKLTF